MARCGTATVWTALSINDLGIADADNYQGFDVAYEANSGDAVIVWNDAGDIQDQHLEWHGLDGASRRHGLHRQ